MTIAATRPSATGKQIVWVDAAPFRAWIRQLVSDSGLHWLILARAAKVSPTSVSRLLRGHHGRTVQRLPKREAERIISLDHTRLDLLAHTPVDPQQVRVLLWSLGLGGCSAEQMAAEIGLDAHTVRTLMSGGTAWCSQLTLIRAESACVVRGIDPEHPAASQQLPSR